MAVQAEALSMKSIQLNADKAAAESALALKEEEVGCVPGCGLLL